MDKFVEFLNFPQFDVLVGNRLYVPSSATITSGVASFTLWPGRIELLMKFFFHGFDYFRVGFHFGFWHLSGFL